MEILEVIYRRPGYGLTGTLTWEQYKARCREADERHDNLKQRIAEGLTWEQYKKERYG